MTGEKKFYIAGTALSLLTIGIFLLAKNQGFTTLPINPNERPGLNKREPSRQARPEAPRRMKDFHSILKLTSTGEFPELTHIEIENYLSAQNRTADSLLAAFRLSRDDAFLKEAVSRFPDHPHVRFCNLFSTTDPTKRLDLIESFKRADPDNGIANCLAARALFDLGKDEEAISELHQFSGKPIQDFTITSCQNVEEAYLTAGLSPAEAKIAALYGATKPALIQMAAPVLNKLDEMGRIYTKAGNTAELQALRDIQSEIGRSLQECGTIADSSVGLIFETNALKAINSPEAITRLEQLNQRKIAMTEAASRIDQLQNFSDIPESEWILYFDRVKLFGEQAANEWMIGRYPDL